MALLDNAKMVEAKRFATVAHASVTNSGRVRFATDAMEMMDLRAKKSVILFSLSQYPDEPAEYAAVPCDEEDPRGFPLKAGGPYVYLSLKNFLVSEAVNFKDFTTTFEITEVNERWEGKSVFRLTLRQTAKPAQAQQIAEQAADSDNLPF